MQKKSYVPAKQEVIPFDKEMTATILAEGESAAECCLSNDGGCGSDLVCIIN